MYPTETVYGLGCLPRFPESIEQLLKIKQRPSTKGLILVGSRRTHLEPFVAPLTESQWQKIESPQPRATTWIVPASLSLSPLISGQHDTVAIRLSNHPVVTRLCLDCDSALISTSANISGQANVRTLSNLPSQITHQAALVLSGPCGPDQRPSQILDIDTGKVTRS